MTTRDKKLIQYAIDNCDEREKRICENYIRLHPENRKRIETNRDLFLFATTMVRMEIDRMIKQEEARA